MGAAKRKGKPRTVRIKGPTAFSSKPPIRRAAAAYRPLGDLLARTVESRRHLAVERLGKGRGTGDAWTALERLALKVAQPRRWQAIGRSGA